MVRELAGVRQALTRIADALERAYPAYEKPAPDSVTVDVPDAAFASKMYAVEQDFWKKFRREPTADELVAHYEDVKHLL